MAITFLDNNDTVNFGNNIKKTVDSQQVTRIDDLSPIEHLLDIDISCVNSTYLLTGVKLYRFGKNLLPTPYASQTQTLNGLTFTVNNTNGTIRVVGQADVDTYFELQTITLAPGQYTLSGCPQTGGGTDTFYLSGFDVMDTGTNATCELTSQTTSTIYIVVKATGTKISKTFSPMIEVGSVKTSRIAYDRYPMTVYELDSDMGYTSQVSGALSLPSTMTLMCLYTDSYNTPPVTMSTTYNRDINVVISELTNAIIALGGEINV